MRRLLLLFVLGGCAGLPQAAKKPASDETLWCYGALKSEKQIIGCFESRSTCEDYREQANQDNTIESVSSECYPTRVRLERD